MRELTFDELEFVSGAAVDGQLVEAVLIGAGAGAFVGGLVGGGLPGAAAGALIGAVAGAFVYYW